MTKSESIVAPDFPLISICIPVYNEEGNISNLYLRLTKLAVSMRDICNFEFIFTDNNSEDETWNRILNLAQQDKRVKAVKFSRNIGFQNSIKFNYLKAKGDAVVQIDADLQDPPELIEDFIHAWMGGAKVVSGLRRGRQESKSTQILRKFGYKVIDRLSENGIQQGVGDFRLLDREVVELIRKVRSPSPYLRGVISSFGYPEVIIEYDRARRDHGESKFGFFQTVKLGLTGILNHSGILIKMSAYLASLTILVAIVLGGYLLILQIAHPSSPKGYTSLAILILFGFGTNALLFTILGSYVTKMYAMLNGEDKFIISSEIS